MPKEEIGTLNPDMSAPLMHKLLDKIERLNDEESFKNNREVSDQIEAAF